jgi:hypothetical protein
MCTHVMSGTYCGISGQDAIPDSIKSTGSDMYVRFRSDSNYQFKGFLARYGYPLATTGLLLHYIPNVRSQLYYCIGTH